MEEGQSEDYSSEVVAAIPARRRPQHKHGGQQGHPKGQQVQQSQQATSRKAGKGKDLCWRHQKYGEDAFCCEDKKNCTWSGN